MGGIERCTWQKGYHSLENWISSLHPGKPLNEFLISIRFRLEIFWEKSAEVKNSLRASAGIIFWRLGSEKLIWTDLLSIEMLSLVFRRNSLVGFLLGAGSYSLGLAEMLLFGLGQEFATGWQGGTIELSSAMPDSPEVESKMLTILPYVPHNSFCLPCPLPEFAVLALTLLVFICFCYRHWW